MVHLIIHEVAEILAECRLDAGFGGKGVPVGVLIGCGLHRISLETADPVAVGLLVVRVTAVDSGEKHVELGAHHIFAAFAIHYVFVLVVGRCLYLAGILLLPFLDDRRS